MSYGFGYSKIAFRVDASVDIGIGHLARCLTLADALRDGGSECHFLCRDLKGHRMDMVHARGHKVHVLQNLDEKNGIPIEWNAPYAHWLGVSWGVDVTESRRILDL